MQVKKADMEQTILMTARDEFFIHGYEDASLRTIAKKANTSLGNIYHYFPNKKAMLDRLLEPVVSRIDVFLHEHVSSQKHVTDMKEINRLLEAANFEEEPMHSLLSKEFAIFIQTKDPDYMKRRDAIMKVFEGHIAWHMHSPKANNHFAAIISKMIIECAIHLIRCDDCVKHKKQDMIEMFSMLCRCVAVQHTDEEDPS
ncbi:TetR family transcriptional regulator [Clostridiaceae bacterium DONG20-135]|uniref:TetR family transcriptional regulator n=1 Tax=Copranaerobaculum intestinale TaxID=2692629 RepID=A0A6N8U527_9FIRM|nr:TetR/AcrR family transcriptional regulator [Copranaerobaculum intestinale]MXQ72414.1 TetR family transcriptional regulator [Copranaerobaculum intestinale]